MPPELSFRRALPTEVEALRALTERASGSHGYDVEFMRMMADDIATGITAEAIVRDTFMVAEIGGRMAGFAHLMPIDRPDTVYLEDLYVAPERQGQGIGRALFEWALSEAGARGYAWLEWDSDPNSAAFYRKMGGEQIGENHSTLRRDRLIPKFRRATGSRSSPGESVGLRQALPADADLLTAICRRAKASHGYDDDFMAVVWDDMVVTAEQITRETVMVAEIDGVAVGFAHLMPLDDPHAICLENLFIEPDQQGRGVGRVLFEWALREAGRLGFAWLEWQSDPNASVFYEKLGATLVSETESATFPGRMIPTFRKATANT
jgi:GNAT superfamily N-acetyltransferase